MAKALERKTSVSAECLLAVAESRLAEFELLRREKRFVTAVYISGYAVEALLKCAICKTLRTQELPIVFHYHDLDSLLFFSGFEGDLKVVPRIYDNFTKFATTWNPEWRYRHPVQENLAAEQICNDVAVWLNDSGEGVVPWLKGRLL